MRFSSNEELHRFNGDRRVTFRCPSCGGSSFGTSSGFVRHCHGDDAGDGAAGCRFSWPQRDDYLYFVLELGEGEGPPTA